MKFQASEIPIGKAQTRRKTSRLAPLIALIFLLTIPLYYPALRDSSKKLYETTSSSPAFDGLEDSISLQTSSSSSHVEEAHENPKDPCATDAAGCSHDEEAGGDDVAVDRHLAPVRKKNDKGRRKRPKRQRIESISPPQKDSPQIDDNRSRPISRSDYHMISNSSGSDKVMALMRGRSAYRGAIRARVADADRCDLFSGEWVPNPDGPYYTNDTCNAIQEHQNCLKFGRPDRGFLRWRWQPDDCELPVVEPARFLEMVRGKSLAFVGDSVARNHMQSLICLLSRVATPVDLSDPTDQNKRYEYRDHDFNISMFWSPYLVRTTRTDPADDRRPFNLFLDEPDPHWSSRLPSFDYAVISAGHWFFRPTYFHLHRRLVGCLYCPAAVPAAHHLTADFSYRRAFRTALRAAAAAPVRGAAFVRTYAPSHFEGAAWDRGGDCRRTRPLRRREAALEDYGLEMYLIQLEELRIAQRGGGGGRFKLFDATVAMLLRPDGHPSRYGNWPAAANETVANDCVHWCLPGPIDAWNDLLQELLRREIGDR